MLLLLKCSAVGFNGLKDEVLVGELEVEYLLLQS